MVTLDNLTNYFEPQFPHLGGLNEIIYVKHATCGRPSADSFCPECVMSVPKADPKKRVGGSSLLEGRT